MDNSDFFRTRSTIKKEIIPPRISYRNTITNFLTIKSLNIDMTCGECGSKLSFGNIHVLTFNQWECAKITGYACVNCKVMFFPDERIHELEKTLTISPNNYLYKLNGLDCHRYYYLKDQEAKEKKKQTAEKRIADAFSICPSTIAFFRTQPMANAEQEETFYLVDNPRDESLKRFVCPSDWRARELLAAYLEESKHRIATFGDLKYRIMEAQFDLSRLDITSSGYKKPSYSRDPRSILLPDLMIAKGGGYAMHIKNQNREKIVDVLLYSPYSKRYETARATYEVIDKNEDRLFMDINKFRAFVEKHGNPGIERFYIERKESRFGKRTDWSDLNAESILTCFGYNVNQTDALDSKTRQRILAEVVDLGFMPQNRVVSHLNFCITTHSSARYAYARSKWNEDKDFIMDYGANPDRFLIPKNITR